MGEILFEVPLYGVVKVHHGAHVPLLHGVHYAVVYVALQNENAGVVQSGAHGGQLKVRSKVGAGTTFSAILPLENIHSAYMAQP